jgi:hypothetical protein
VLQSNKLNLVGELHSESDSRRDAEKRFCLATINDPGYWVEHEFPDAYEGNLSNLPGVPEADLMEYRGTHGVALAIKEFDKLGDQAVGVSATRAGDAPAALGEFHTKVVDLLRYTLRVKNSWRPSRTTEVNLAVKAVYDHVVAATQAYRDAHQNASVQDQLTALRDFANSRIILRDMVPTLAKAVGATLTDDRDATELANYMRRQRSAFMAVGAVSSGLVGVWKVGDGHIADLKNGTAKVDVRRINVVTRQEFNTEFQGWQGN